MSKMNDFDDDHLEKDRNHKDRLKRSNKARERRQLIKDKKQRQYDSGMRGNV